MSKKKLVVWFDDGGRLLSHAGTFADMTRRMTSYGSKIQSEEAQDFYDRLKFVRISDRYRGAARVVLQSQLTGRQYTMFVDNFNIVVNDNRFNNLLIEGTFRFLKKGTAQAIMLLPADKTSTP